MWKDIKGLLAFFMLAASCLIFWFLFWEGVKCLIRLF
jgi:hypothetical protein